MFPECSQVTFLRISTFASVTLNPQENGTDNYTGNAVSANLLTKEDRKKKESKEEKDELSSIPPIPNAMAARLLHMSTRQLQRVRRRYQLKWEERGREVFYHLVPLLKAISRLNLKWSETVLEEIKRRYKKVPAL